MQYNAPLVITQFLYYINICIYMIINDIGFICREEIQRIKANNPDISHREAFSTAAKNVCMHETKFNIN